MKYLADKGVITVQEAKPFRLFILFSYSASRFAQYSADIIV